LNDKEIALAFIGLLAIIGNIIFTIVRTRSTIDTVKVQEEADELARKSSLEDKRLEVWAAMVSALKATTERLDSMSNAQRQTNQIGVQTSETLDHQAETLESVQALQIGLNKTLDDHRKETAPAIDVITSVPARLDAVKTDLSAVRAATDKLPETVKTELAPTLTKLDEIETKVEDLAIEVRAMRADVTSAIRSALLAIPTPTPVKVEPSNGDGAKAEPVVAVTPDVPVVNS
jgi:septation ring formation regulator EzrA